MEVYLCLCILGALMYIAFYIVLEYMISKILSGFYNYCGDVLSIFVSPLRISSETIYRRRNS